MNLPPTHFIITSEVWPWDCPQKWTASARRFLSQKNVPDQYGATEEEAVAKLRQKIRAFDRMNSWLSQVPVYNQDKAPW
jgi:hypothetical protein